MADIRLIDANKLFADLKQELDDIPKRTNYPIGIRDGLSFALATIDCAPTIDAIPVEKWRELKETIIEMRDNGGTGTQQEVCHFLANLIDVIERK